MSRIYISAEPHTTKKNQFFKAPIYPINDISISGSARVVNPTIEQYIWSNTDALVHEDLIIPPMIDTDILSYNDLFTLSDVLYALGYMYKEIGSQFMDKLEPECLKIYNLGMNDRKGSDLITREDLESGNYRLAYDRAGNEYFIFPNYHLQI